MNPLALQIALGIIFLIGSIMIIAAIFNWKLFFENKKTNFLTERMGQNKARLLYGCIGLLVILMGIYAIYNGFLEDENLGEKIGW